MKAFGTGFLAQPRTPEAAAAAETGPAMAAGTALLAVPCLVLGVIPGAVMPLLARAAGTVLGGTPDPLRAGASLALAGSADVVQPALLAAALLGRPRSRLGACPPPRPCQAARRAEAWGCGREQQTPRMQYTATSFAEPLQRVFDDVLRPDRDLDVSHARRVALLRAGDHLPQPDR